MEGEKEPEVAAREYESVLAALIRLPGEDQGEREDSRSLDTGPPRLDLALLGVGEDGHTASLFPGEPTLDEERRWVVPTSAHGGVRRVTLTMPVLQASRRLLVLAAGQSKALALGRLLRGGAGDLPAARLLAARGKVTFLVDREAASNLDLRRPAR
jgi:6-phosphogluconolactonase